MRTCDVSVMPCAILLVTCAISIVPCTIPVMTRAICVGDLRCLRP